MTTLFVTLFLLSLLRAKPVPAHAKPDPHGDFFQLCPPSTCGSMQIRSPLRLRTSPPSCGYPGLDLTCSDDGKTLTIPTVPPLQVVGVDYRTSSLTVRVWSGFGSLSSPCPLQGPIPNQTSSDFKFLESTVYTLSSWGITLVSCSHKFIPGPDSGNIAGPIQCLSGSGQFVYAVDESETIQVIPAGRCTVLKTGLWIPVPVVTPEYSSVFRADVDNLGRREIFLSWCSHHPLEVPDGCESCAYLERLCGYNWETNQTVCQEPLFEEPPSNPDHDTGKKKKNFIPFLKQ